MKRISIFLLITLVFSGILAGCGTDSEETTSITIKKDGTVENTIVEEFGDTYNVDDLKNMLLSKVADFNKTSSGDDISVGKVEQNKNGTVTVAMTFPSATDYELFNNTDTLEDVPFYVGTIEDAYSNGYNLDVTLTSTGKDAQTISRDEILAMGNQTIIIYDNTLNLGEMIQIDTFSKVKYVSDNVSLVGNKSVQIVDNEGVAAYIICN